MQSHFPEVKMLLLGHIIHRHSFVSSTLSVSKYDNSILQRHNTIIETIAKREQQNDDGKPFVKKARYDYDKGKDLEILEE